MNAVDIGGFVDDADMRIAVLASGRNGIVTFDSSQFDQPIILGQLELSGDAQDVSIDASSSIAVVASGSGGLHFVDISDPIEPKLLQTASLNTTQVEVQAGIGYAFSGQAIFAFDVLSGALVKSNQVNIGQSTTGLAVQGDVLYAMDFSNTLHAYQLDDYVVTELGTLQLAAGAGRISVNGDVLYAVAKNGDRGGYSTVDVSDPTNMALISEPDIASPFVGPGSSIAPNGSGLGLLVGSARGQHQIDLMNLGDSQETNELVTRFSIGSAPVDVVIASGIGYVAAGNGGLHVVNYVGFDNQGTAPIVTITGPSGDSIEEGSSVSIRVNVTDDVQVRDVELLVNGSVVQRDNSAPYDLRGIAPAITESSGSVSFQVRATDTGGNSSLSNTLTYSLTPDITAPTLLGTNLNPSNIGVDLSSLVLTFDQPIDASILQTSRFSVTDLASGAAAPISRIRLQGDRRIVIQFADPLADGRFQLTASANSVADLAGNSLAAPVDFSFTNVRRQVGVNRWIAGDGVWSDVFNWSQGRVPDASERVIIGSEDEPINVVIDVGTVVSGGTIHGNVSFRNNGNVSTSGPLELATVTQMARFPYRLLNFGSISFPELTSIANAELTIGAGQALHAPMLTQFTNSVLNLSADGEFETAALTSINSSRLLLSDGAVYRLPATEINYVSRVNSQSNLATFEARGAGTILDLSALLTVDVQYENGGFSGARQFIAASDGATVDLSNVTTITGGGRVSFADGPFELRTQTDGRIDLSSLHTVAGTGTGIQLNFAEPLVTLPELATAANVRITIADSGAISAPLLTSIASGQVTIGSGQSLRAPRLSEFTSSVLNLNSTGRLVSGQLTISAGSRIAGSGLIEGDVINSGQITVGAGDTISIDGSYSQTSGGVLLVRASGTAQNDQFGRLAISDELTLGGKLVVGLEGGFRPIVGDTFALMTFGSKSGEFETLESSDLQFDLKVSVRELLAELHVVFEEA